jgi:hypothetical protein
MIKTKIDYSNLILEIIKDSEKLDYIDKALGIYMDGKTTDDEFVDEINLTDKEFSRELWRIVRDIALERDVELIKWRLLRMETGDTLIPSPK